MSLYQVTEQIRRNHGGMMIALPPPEWRVFRGMSPRELAETLRELARGVRLSALVKAPTRPKKPRPARKYDPTEPHVSTARVLKERRRR